MPIYSVISPEGAASILWHDSTRAKDAATNMKITAQDLLDLKIIDGIIPEPLGGAHRGADAVIAATGDQIARTLSNSPARTWISASSGAKNIWRWAAACSIADDRHRFGAFPPQKCRRWRSRICREGRRLALAVINFQG